MKRSRKQRRELERRDVTFERKETLPAPVVMGDETRALDALGEIIERKVGYDESRQPRFTSPAGVFASVYRWALTCMANEPASRAPARVWDAWYRDFAKKEPFLSGVLNSAVQIDKNRGWTLTGGRNQVAKYMKRLHDIDDGAGWRTYIDWQAQSYYTTRMGFVSETGREGKGGPMVTLWSVDPCRSEMTGNPEFPLRYYPRSGGMQEWTPDMFIRGKSMVSTDEFQIDYGYPAVARCYDLAKIMIGVYSHYQQKVGTKTPDGVLTGKYIGEEQWEDAIRARNESLRADPDSYLNSIATIMSSGGDMPEFALTLLSSIPDRWDIDIWTQILMRGYALAFGYQSSEFYPEPAGVMGRGKEQEIQQRSATGKGGKDFALSHQEQIQSVLPPTIEFQYEERDVTGEQADAALKLAKAQVITEMTKWLVNTQNVLTTAQVMQLAADDGIIPDAWTPSEEQVTATDEETNQDSERIYRACMAFPSEPIVRYHWPSGKTRILRISQRKVFYFPKVMERSIGQVVRAYRDALTNWAYETMNGRMEVADMRRAHKALIRKTAQEVYFEGMREGGIRNPADEADEADFGRIQDWVKTQIANADDFATATSEVSGDETKRASIISRLGLWVDSVDSLGQQGVMSAKSNRPGIWHLGQTEQHCTTCLTLNGKRHRVNWFLTRGYIPRQPGSEMLECGGWACDCRISDATTGETLV